ncbi:TetR/AcrR family transcriptional regulator [Glycomyces terrestris]|uniref:TetR/AcrR family transcriptional regulator n=1 Tax=Glycomyces terrestris TaxID=2493553 RepID=UPI0013157396|nr:TetR/AcrR family transcriptional regulator [Glycomyces terrestris]
MHTTAKRAERADAQRNRRKVLETADRLFGEGGTAVSLGEIAAAAGVGAGTVYRHFPTKDALLATVLDRRLAALGDYGAEMVRHPDPEAAFFAYLGFLADQALANRAICEALAGRGDWMEPTKAAGSCVIDSPLAVLLRRVQDSGAVRGDLDLEDVRALLSCCVGMAAATGSRDRARRLAEVVWDGLRTERNPENRNETPVGSEPRDETVVTEGGCPVCGGPIAHAGTGRPAKFCSPACRQRAFREKRKRSA